MSFQWIFDNCSGLTIDRRPTTARSITRNNRVSAVVRSGYTYRFTVKMPDGYRYEEARPYIEAYEELGLHTVGSISISQDYITGYRGDATNISNWTATGTSGRTLQGINPVIAPTNGDKILAAGDYVQLGVGNTYNVVEDVVWPADTATLNRAIQETGAQSLIIGPSVDWDVICVTMPQWNIFDYNLVTWQDPFVFYEVVR